MSTDALAQVVTFRLGDDLFAADIAAVERVLRHQPPTPVPNLPAWIEGVIDYRGQVVPVLDLRKRFELPAAAVTASTRILVFTVEANWVAAVVDAVVEVTALSSRELSAPPPLFRGLAAEYLSGIARRGDQLVVYLNVARILTATERLALERVAETAAANG
jgi:purine-binding chemotaxis protein CheW